MSSKERLKVMRYIQTVDTIPKPKHGISTRAGASWSQRMTSPPNPKGRGASRFTLAPKKKKSAKSVT